MSGDRHAGEGQSITPLHACRDSAECGEQQAFASGGDDGAEVDTARRTLRDAERHGVVQHQADGLVACY